MAADCINSEAVSGGSMDSRLSDVSSLQASDDGANQPDEGSEPSSSGRASDSVDSAGKHTSRVKNEFPFVNPSACPVGGCVRKRFTTIKKQNPRRKHCNKLGSYADINYDLPITEGMRELPNEPKECRSRKRKKHAAGMPQQAADISDPPLPVSVEAHVILGSGMKSRRRRRDFGSSRIQATGGSRSVPPSAPNTSDQAANTSNKAATSKRDAGVCDLASPPIVQAEVPVIPDDGDTSTDPIHAAKDPINAPRQSEIAIADILAKAFEGIPVPSTKYHNLNELQIQIDADAGPKDIQMAKIGAFRGSSDKNTADGVQEGPAAVRNEECPTVGCVRKRAPCTILDRPSRVGKCAKRKKVDLASTGMMKAETVFVPPYIAPTPVSEKIPVGILEASEVTEGCVQKRRISPRLNCPRRRGHLSSKSEDAVADQAALAAKNRVAAEAKALLEGVKLLARSPSTPRKRSSPSHSTTTQASNPCSENAQARLCTSNHPEQAPSQTVLAMSEQLRNAPAHVRLVTVAKTLSMHNGHRVRSALTMLDLREACAQLRPILNIGLRPPRASSLIIGALSMLEHNTTLVISENVQNACDILLSAGEMVQAAVENGVPSNDSGGVASNSSVEDAFNMSEQPQEAKEASVDDVCNVANCRRLCGGKRVNAPDGFGRQGLRCLFHMGGKFCNVLDCGGIVAGIVVEHDRFAAAGSRCAKHGGTWRADQQLRPNTHVYRA